MASILWASFGQSLNFQLILFLSDFFARMAVKPIFALPSQKFYRPADGFLPAGHFVLFCH